MMRKRAARPFPWRCPKCLKREVRAGTLDRHVTTVKHDGRGYAVSVDNLRVARCGACGEVVFTLESDEQISRALRDQLGLLLPEEIRALRGRRRQEELGDLLGIAAETVSRWETGAVIQSRALDNLLRLYATVPGVEDALRRRRDLSRAGPPVRRQPASSKAKRARQRRPDRAGRVRHAQ